MRTLAVGMGPCRAGRHDATQHCPSLLFSGLTLACLVPPFFPRQGAFTQEEAAEYIRVGALNALFVLGRTTGFIGHYIDQKRLKQGLYRHPWDDIAYLTRPTP